jgi:hypothetical protein
MRSPRTHAGLAAVVLALLALGTPGAQAAKTCEAPPGRSAIVEYCELVPGDNTHGKAHAVPNPARGELRRAGPTGAALLALARQVPARGHLRGRPSPPPALISGLPFALGHAGSPGWLLPLVLLAIAVVLAASAWWRWRQRRRRRSLAAG